MQLPARPSGTEHINKSYAESFQDEQHLDAIVTEVQEMVHNALAGFSCCILP
jgi:phosphoglucomutase